MKFYIATAFNQQSYGRGVRAALQRMGHQVTSRWLDVEASQDPGDPTPEAVMDLDDIDAADAVICFPTPAMRGGWVEVGYALGMWIPVAIVPLEETPPVIFEALCIRCVTWQEAVKALEESLP